MPHSTIKTKVKGEGKKEVQPLNESLELPRTGTHGGPQTKQQHHCPVCGKIPSGQCFKRGHLVVCEKHNNQHNPRNACVKCQGEEERAALAAIEERAREAEKPPTPDPWTLEKERKKAKKEQRKSKSKRRSSTGN